MSNNEVERAGLSTQQKTIIGVLAGVGGALVLGAAAQQTYLWYECKKIEKPEYEVVKVINAKPYNIEIRKYQKYTIAQTTIAKSDMKDASRTGFIKIAGYIFGKNKKAVPGKLEKSDGGDGASTKEDFFSEKISMTAPVQMDQGQGTYKMSFVMPSKYNLDSLPAPEDSSIELKEVPPKQVAVVSFSGWSSKKVWEKYSSYLTETLKKEDTSYKGNPSLWQYHPPFLLGFLRTNEVAVDLE